MAEGLEELSRDYNFYSSDEFEDEEDIEDHEDDEQSFGISTESFYGERKEESGSEGGMSLEMEDSIKEQGQEQMVHIFQKKKKKKLKKRYFQIC